MKVLVVRTPEMTSGMWASYEKAFTKSFGRELDVGRLKHRFMTTTAGCSFHSLLMSSESTVEGACSVIPYDYFSNGQVVRWGLVMGAFIQPSARSDPFHLKKMFEALREFCSLNDIKVLFSVPNETAYPYWKSVVGWRDIGDLPYYVLPIRLGTLCCLAKPWRKFADVLSSLVVDTWIRVANLLCLIWNTVETKPLIRLEKHAGFQDHRYWPLEKYTTIKSDSWWGIYSTVKEEKGNVAYVLEFERCDGGHDAKALAALVREIYQNCRPAAIVFIGNLAMRQYSLLRLPKFLEPQRMPLMVAGLKNPNEKWANGVFEIGNWRFGLLNYDIR